jgi:acyl carrier protein
VTPESLVANVFGIPADTITDESSNQTVKEWDSLGHITLILDLEQTYGVSLGPDEALTLTSVGAIKQMLRDRGIGW